MNIFALWMERNRREQLVMISGVVILLIIAAYLILEPVIEDRDGFARAIPDLRADLAWMQAHSSELQELRSNKGITGNEEKSVLTLSIVEASLRESGIRDYIEELGRTSGGGITISAREVAFSDMVKFLYLLSSRSYGIVESAQIDSLGDKSGMVSARVILRQNNP